MRVISMYFDTYMPHRDASNPCDSVHAVSLAAHAGELFKSVPFMPWNGLSGSSGVLSIPSLLCPPTPSLLLAPSPELRLIPGKAQP